MCARYQDSMANIKRNHVTNLSQARNDWGIHSKRVLQNVFPRSTFLTRIYRSCNSPSRSDIVSDFISTSIQAYDHIRTFWFYRRKLVSSYMQVSGKFPFIPSLVVSQSSIRRSFGHSISSPPSRFPFFRYFAYGCVDILRESSIYFLQKAPM